MAAVPEWIRVLDEADEDTARMIIESQLQDLDELEGGQDIALARQTYETELKRYRGSRRDAKDETPLVQAPVVIASDEAVVSAIPLTINENGKRPASPTTDDEDAKRQKVKEDSVEVVEPVIQLFECAACNDRKPVSEVWQVPCDHFYCLECIETLYCAAIADESLYPPRCCQTAMPYEDIRWLLPEALRAEFEAKKEELDNKDRIYCYEPTCSAYIALSAYTDGVATSPGCERKTCVICKAAAHESDCPEDMALQEVLRMASDEGWQRCPTCKNMLEHTHGCWHMT
ncbi:hypothetical protein LTR36_006464 [Oleoguttula mirabilis]|uniref:RBR-type E3 ubiquitin transferase n=1 Tax=Oleoguttula mirabilis TaxID=1507867 RepID=A0AAV9JUS6_9PEZI|nr:hypothetical protein LTR36_006464 [Oleoguttula mirabilis]